LINGGGTDGDKEAVDALITFLCNNDTYESTETSFYLQPSAALADNAAIEIYNIGFYTLGDILNEYEGLSSGSWRFTKSELGELQSYNGDNNNIVKINSENEKTTLNYNYLRARSLANMPDTYTRLDLRNMALADGQSAIKQDAFEGLTFTTILLKPEQYKLFPTMNKYVVYPNSRYWAYKDGVDPAQITEALDGAKNTPGYSYTRNFKSGNNSCALPFNVNVEELPAGLTAYEFSSYNNGVAYFKEATGVIEAATPLMIKADEAGLYLIPAASTPNLLTIFAYRWVYDDNDNMFVGSFVKEIPSVSGLSNRFALDSEATSFKKMGDDVKTTYYRAFLALKDAAAESKAITMSFDGETTGISQVKENAVEDGAYYNLQGVKMNPDNLPHGIYIHNGKKIVK